MDSNNFANQLQEVLKVYSYLWSLPVYRYLVIAWALLGALVGLIPMLLAFKKGQRIAGVQALAASICAAMFSPLLLLVMTPLSVLMINHKASATPATSDLEQN